MVHEPSALEDARTGELAWWLNEVKGATQREVYDCSLGSCVIDYYDSTYNYTFGRSEGQPVRGINPITGKAGDDLLYDRLEVVRRHYLDIFNLDIFNINGANGQGCLGDGSFVPVNTARVPSRLGWGKMADGTFRPTNL